MLEELTWHPPKANEEIFDSKYRVLEIEEFNWSGFSFGPLMKVWEISDPDRKIKLLKPFALASRSELGMPIKQAEHRQREFEEQARIAMRFELPIVPLIDFGMTGMEFTIPYVVRDFIPGSSLRTVMNNRRLPAQEIVTRFSLICDALSSCHDQGLTFGGFQTALRPEKIIFNSRQENVCLLDAWMDRLYFDGLDRPELITRWGQECIKYWSPELCIGSNFGTHSVIYAVGCMMFECLSGRPVYTGETIIDMMQKQYGGPLPSFEPADEVPTTLEALVLRALAKDPAIRQKNFAQLKLELLSAI